MAEVMLPFHETPCAAIPKLMVDPLMVPSTGPPDWHGLPEIEMVPAMVEPVWTMSRLNVP